MINRSAFIRRVVSGIVMLPILGLKNPLECSEPGRELRTTQYMRDLEADYRQPWPNEQAFPCILGGRIQKVADCGSCRGRHNRIIVAWSPERWKGLVVDPATGKVGMEWGLTAL